MLYILQHARAAAQHSHHVQVYWLLSAIAQDQPKNKAVGELRDMCERAALEGSWVRQQHFMINPECVPCGICKNLFCVGWQLWLSIVIPDVEPGARLCCCIPVFKAFHGCHSARMLLQVLPDIAIAWSCHSRLCKELSPNSSCRQVS